MLMLEVIGRIGRSSTVLSFFKLRILAIPENRACAKPVWYNLLHSCCENLDFIFLKAFCIFRSVAAVGSFVSHLNGSVFNNAIHFSVYLVVSNITTPLLLSCFKIKMFSRLSLIFWYLYGTLILLYFSQVLLSLVFNDVNSLPDNMFENFFKHIKKKHGHDLIKTARDFEQKKTKFEKLVADIAFIKLCKKEQFIPTFTKVNVSIRIGTY